MLRREGGKRERKVWMCWNRVDKLSELTTDHGKDLDQSPCWYQRHHWHLQVLFHHVD